MGNNDSRRDKFHIALERRFPFELGFAVVAFRQMSFDSDSFGSGQFLVDQSGNQFLCFVTAHRLSLAWIFGQIVAEQDLQQSTAARQS